MLDQGHVKVKVNVKHTVVFALHLLNPWWDLQITRYKCQIHMISQCAMRMLNQGRLKSMS